MKRKYLAFDIETAKDVPGKDFDWKAHRPLGICCAAALPGDTGKPIIWHGTGGGSGGSGGKPAPRLSQDEARRVVEELEQFVAAGYTLLTWNGLGFDFDLLGEEADARDRCRTLAHNHVDMMFHFFCAQGYPAGLEKAAEGMGIAGKPAGMSGDQAPRLWARGQQQQVLEYVAQYVRIALQIGDKADQQQGYR